MARVRLSTTVDPDLLDRARRLRPGSDASLVEAALAALLKEHRRAEVDAAYASAYLDHPVDEPDAWGDLASFGAAVRSR